MSNVVRNGFSTLNRLLGKKNKNGSNGGLSKSSTNLNRSTTNLDATSQQHNKITPLAASTNAPFEQTFRITVCLPLDQLYVARVGAKTKLIDVLAMVCANKLLDPAKFEFRHPTDDTQVFELDLTIGEVGLNEIRLAPKSCHVAAAVHEDIKYRTHSNHVQSAHTQSDYRFTLINQNHQRPHTISASPYSSTNSLNSTDSSGPLSTFRTNALPSVPCRKKRIAPRPPSQNSIPEDKEQNVAKDKGVDVDDGVFKRPQLIRQNFHVSSPNIMETNLLRGTSKGDANADTPFTDSEQSKIVIAGDDNSLKRSLSMQSHEHELANGSRTHSRTSSDTSEMDGNWPEPAPRKRIFIGKKKAAPSPPPRVSSVNHVPVATPRNILQKLTEEHSKETEEIVEANSEEVVPHTPPVASVETTTVVTAISQTHTPAEPNARDAPPKLNVSKVMLNVEEISVNPEANANESTENIFSHKISQTSTTANGHNVSRTQINGTTSELVSSTPKIKSISVVELNVVHANSTEIEQRITELEHADLSKEVNEIIDKAIEINEARLSAAINGDDWLPDKVDEVNNNHTYDAKSESPLWIYTLPAPPTFADGKAVASMKSNENCAESDSGVCAASPKGSLSSDDEIKIIAAPVERPIEPIICEKSPIDFHHETSDNSLPTSSTYGTMSTEPESLRTSDIEDGYKGSSSHTPQVSGEQFVETEFEFLANEGYDAESSASPSANPSASASPTKEELPPINGGMDKASVIQELTTIISANRLDTVIKPNDETDTIETTATTKRSTLSNFQIGAYNGNENHENVCPKPAVPTVADKSSAVQRYKRHSLVENSFDSNENSVRRSSTPKRASLTNGLELDVNADNSKDNDSNVVKAPKYVSRSKSFHSTLSWSAVRNANAESRLDPLAQTSPRSTSFVSLNGTQRGLSQRSSSELSIADSPSLQSVEVLRSIMNSSRKNSVGESPVPIKTTSAEKFVASNGDHGVTLPSPANENRHVNGKPKIEPKTWKYEGPPSINLSTWGERPKSQVFIKSDSDYKFGGISKMAALQKRFSAAIANADQPAETAVGNADAYKLPIVRGVEFKRTASTDRNGNNGVAPSVDTIDSEIELRSVRRPSYEISRIVSEKPINFTTMTLGRGTSSKKHEDAAAKNQFSQARTSVSNTNGGGYVQRVVSFNGNVVHAPVVKGFKPVDIISSGQQQSDSRQPLVKLSTYEAAPPFSQFTLRKTGLKEKILDESNNNVSRGHTKSNANDAVQRIVVEESKNKRNIVPTAPKPPPPPISQKPTGRNSSIKSMNRSQSMPVDPRNELLDSIRNFNRTALKKC